MDTNNRPRMWPIVAAILLVGAMICGTIMHAAHWKENRDVNREALDKISELRRELP